MKRIMNLMVLAGTLLMANQSYGWTRYEHRHSNYERQRHYDQREYERRCEEQRREQERARAEAERRHRYENRPVYARMEHSRYSICIGNYGTRFCVSNPGYWR